MIQGGWVCRACWKPNGPGQERCYRCHTPRDQQFVVEAGSLTERTEAGSELKGRLDTELPVLAFLTAWPLRVYGIGVILLGALTAFVGFVGPREPAPDIMGLPAQTFVMLLGGLLVLVGLLQVFIANSVGRHERWAYALALILGIGGSAPRILGLSLPAVTGQATAVGWWIGAWLYLGMALCAAALLLTSFIRRPVE